MNRLLAILVLSLTVVSLNVAVASDEAQALKQAGQAKHATVELSELLDAVARKSDMEFLIDRRVPVEVVVGTVKLRDVDYAVLLTILRNNALAAAMSDDVVRIVPVNIVRHHELPILRDNDDSMANDEWVTRLVQVSNGHAARLVPLLRPMVPQAGHLVAETDSNLLIIVAPYGVTERLVDIVYEINQRTDQAQASTQ